MKPRLIERSGASLALSLIMTMPAIADDATACNLNGKTIEAAFTLWGNSVTSSGTISSPELKNEKMKAEIVGNKVLLSYFPDDAEGQVYYLGKTVDAMTDSLQSKQYNKPHPGMAERHLLTAAYDGVDLRLSDAQDMTFIRTNTTVLHISDDIRITVLSCTTCVMLSFDRRAVGVPDIELNGHLVDESCWIH